MSLHWLDNADSWICPVCGFETSSPAKYEGCKCPKCGFQDEKDKIESEEQGMKYRKKPVVIEAIQINTNPSEIKEFVGEACKIEYCDTAYEVGKFRPTLFVTIHTLEGDMEAHEGDYIIKGVKGEFYPCRKDIFEETYEKAEREEEK